MNLTLFHIFKQFGPEIIARKAAGIWFIPRLGHISKQLSKNPQKHQTQKEFDRLWQRYPQREVKHSDAMARRYDILLFDPGQIYGTLYPTELGCVNTRCPQLLLLTLYHLPGVKMSTLRPEERQFVIKWGHDLKLCGS